ncbi:MAG: DUF1553 domain-containing protein [Anditalea sp.]
MNIWTKRAGVPLLVLGLFGLLVIWGLYAVSPEIKQTYFPQLFIGDQIEFNRDIRPILNKNCIVCHGGVKQSGGFSLLFPDEAFAPNESGKPAIVAGSPDKSEMIRRIRHHDPEVRMPLEEDPLSDKEIELLTTWIEQGAQWQDHWAYIKPEEVVPPSPSSAWENNAIDQFVLHKMKASDLEPSAEAGKAILLRRVYLDLIGIPPTQNELQNFLDDESPDAYEKVVDTLLSSPHYGERWTSMWMDLARYADSKGYEKDAERKIWKYRDWLIHAFNKDMPYDEFITKQLAGDLLPNPTDDHLIATAFHRNTMTNDEGGTDNEEFRVAALIDRVNTTWSVLQGTTMECVQCHSHPYDAIRHKDFFKSYAFFNNTADEDVASETPKLITFNHEEERQDLEEIKNWVKDQSPVEEEKVAYYTHLIRLTEPKIHPHSFDEIKNGVITDGPNYLLVEDGGQARIKDVLLKGENSLFIRYRANKSTGLVEIRMDHPEGEQLGSWRIKKNKEGSNFETISIPVKPTSGKRDLYFVFKDPGQKGAVCTIEWILFHEALPGKIQPGYPEVKKKFISLLNQQEGVSTIPVMVELPEGYKRKTHIFERGNWMVHGEEVQPGVPEDWNEMPEGAPKNRLGLAQWLVSKDNPLTARVMVNRIWAQVFGTGIVETLEDFGSQGFAPSHPELLDWLALQFMEEHQWSLKKLLRQIVMSATYRQSSDFTPELLAIDPYNRLLARGPRVRLDAEQIRDQALAVSGLLSYKMYGPSVMPPQPEGLWQVVYSGLEWITSPGEDKYRRALYTFWRRTNPYPSLMSFDSPSREFCVTRRIDTNTPIQALVTLNDPVYMETALGLALRMVKADQHQVEKQISEGYRIAMAKEEIDLDKMKDLQLLYSEVLHHFEKNPEAAEALIGKEDIKLASLTVVANAIMNLDEFITKS